jgi:hypothetical protein
VFTSVLVEMKALEVAGMAAVETDVKLIDSTDVLVSVSCIEVANTVAVIVPLGVVVSLEPVKIEVPDASRAVIVDTKAEPVVAANVVVGEPVDDEEPVVTTDVSGGTIVVVELAVVKLNVSLRRVVAAGAVVSIGASTIVVGEPVDEVATVVTTDVSDGTIAVVELAVVKLNVSLRTVVVAGAVVSIGASTIVDGGAVIVFVTNVDTCIYVAFVTSVGEENGSTGAMVVAAKVIVVLSTNVTVGEFVFIVVLAGLEDIEGIVDVAALVVVFCGIACATACDVAESVLETELVSKTEIELTTTVVVGKGSHFVAVIISVLVDIALVSLLIVIAVSSVEHPVVAAYVYAVMVSGAVFVFDPDMISVAFVVNTWTGALTLGIEVLDLLFEPVFSKVHSGVIQYVVGLFLEGGDVGIGTSIASGLLEDEPIVVKTAFMPVDDEASEADIGSNIGALEEKTSDGTDTVAGLNNAEDVLLTPVAISGITERDAIVEIGLVDTSVVAAAKPDWHGLESWRLLTSTHTRFEYPGGPSHTASPQQLIHGKRLC